MYILQVYLFYTECPRKTPTTTHGRSHHFQQDSPSHSAKFGFFRFLKKVQKCYFLQTLCHFLGHNHNFIILIKKLFLLETKSQSIKFWSEYTSDSISKVHFWCLCFIKLEKILMVHSPMSTHHCTSDLLVCFHIYIRMFIINYIYVYT